jgi:hypothetical protein
MNPNWQRANIQAAASYLREVMGRTPGDGRAKVVYEGQASRERRATHERRSKDRRQVNTGSPTGVERRQQERRTGPDRRSRSRG